jgi:peptidoglycan/xylan/chitin deacetylase (PgdA/CDA1 family)
LPRWRNALTSGLTIFIFHEITDSPSEFHRSCATYTSPKVFSEQIAWIAERFTIIEPLRLRQFGGSGELPPSAAMITFDDAWAGVFRVGLPILRERGIPALCFLNMATVAGDPDLGAVRAYEISRPELGSRLLASPIDPADGEVAVARIRARYGVDAAFLEYQGPTANDDDLTRASHGSAVWFGSHLYHHWDIRSIGLELYVRSFTENESALAKLPNSLPAFATPHGYAGGDGGDPFSIPARHGASAIFTGTGNQNACADGMVLDRLFFPVEPSTSNEWWYATHRRRVLGRRTG